MNSTVKLSFNNWVFFSNSIFLFSYWCLLQTCSSFVRCSTRDLSPCYSLVYFHQKFPLLCVQIVLIPNVKQCICSSLDQIIQQPSVGDAVVFVFSFLCLFHLHEITVKCKSLCVTIRPQNEPHVGNLIWLQRDLIWSHMHRKLFSSHEKLKPGETNCGPSKKVLHSPQGFL